MVARKIKNNYLTNQYKKCDDSEDKFMIDLNLKEVEKPEFKHLNYTNTASEQNIGTIIDGINSRLQILKDWKSQFLKTARKSYSATDLDKGAERIFHHVLSPNFKFPNSTPIGSDLVYMVHDSIIHIDVKTVSYSNISDFKGKIQIGKNQTSYKMNEHFQPNLPSKYKTVNRLSVTYAIYILHKQFENVMAMEVISIPNGLLHGVYGNDIMQSGKSGWERGNDVRYNFNREPLFKLLSTDNEKIYRVRLIAMETTELNPKEIISSNYDCSPTFILKNGKIKLP